MRFLRHKMYWLTVHQVLMVLTIVIAAVGALGSLAGSGDVRCLCGVFRAWLCRVSELHVACHAAGAHHHARHHGVGAGERGRVVGSPGLRDQVLPQQALPAYSIRVRVVSMGVLNVSLYSLVCMCSLHACVCIRGCAFGTCTPSAHCRRLYRRIHKVLGYCAALLACACLYTGLGMTAPLASSSPCAALTVMRMCVWLCVARLDEQVI